MDAETAQERLLDGADRLFYGRGLQNVSVHDVRAASGVSLKRLYSCYPSKEALITAYLERRDRHWRADLREFVAAEEDPVARVLLVFDSLEDWFQQAGFRGCAFINAFGELGAASPAIAEAARAHKAALFEFLHELAADTDTSDPEALARQLVILVDGAIVSAAFNGQPVTLADDALTRESVLTIERRTPPGEQGRAATGRTLEAPARLNLVLRGERCFLVRAADGREWELSEARCVPAPAGAG